MPEQDADTIRVVEERATISTRELVTGRVRVSTRTDVAEEIATADLRHDTVEVTRVPVDREVDVAPSVRTEGDVTIVPVLEEVAVIHTRLVLKEEIHIRRISASETVEVPVTLRKQQAVVERDPPAALSPDPD